MKTSELLDYIRDELRAEIVISDKLLDWQKITVMNMFDRIQIKAIIKENQHLTNQQFLSNVYARSPQE